MKRKSLFIDDYLIIILVLSSIIILPILNKSQIATYGIIPFTFIWYIYKDSKRNKILSFRSYNLFILFFLWGLITSIWAIDIHLSVITQRRLLIIILYVYSIISYGRKSKSAIKVLLNLQLLSLLILQFYVFFISGIQIDFGYSVQDQFEFNSNTYGYYIYIGITSGYMLYLNAKYKMIYKLYLSIIILSSSIILILSASRGGFIVLAVTVLFNTIVLYKNQKQFSNKFLFKSLFLIAGCYLTYNMIVEPFLKETYLFQRFYQLEQHESPRTLHFFEALRVGWNNPFGVGGGNYALVPRWFEQGNFSHNGFTEAYANYGYIGVSLFFFLFVEYFIAIRKISLNNRIVNIKIINLHYVFLFTFILYNIFYVSYLTLEFMGIFFIYRMHLYQLANQVKCKILK